MQPLFHKQQNSFFAQVALLLAVSAVVLCILSGVGTQLNWWHFSAGFVQLRWSVYIAIGSIVCAAVGITAIMSSNAKKGMVLAIISVVFAAPVIIVPVQWKRTASVVPPIHDITTDTVNPPQFNELVSLRGDDANSLEYEGKTIAELQIQAYPEVKPLILEKSQVNTFDLALAVARDMRWEVVSANVQDRRIEAIHTTFWFGFKDDIVVRISASNTGGSKVDVRSVSRVGRSDLGTNARRIERYLQAIQERL